jgi:hypothetical protein
LLKPAGLRHYDAAIHANFPTRFRATPFPKRHGVISDQDRATNSSGANSTTRHATNYVNISTSGFPATLAIDRIIVHRRRLTTHGVERSILRLRAGGHDGNRPEAFLRRKGQLAGESLNFPAFFIERRYPRSTRVAENGDWFGSSLLGRRLDKCFATALGNHVKSRMPTPLDVLSAHQMRNCGTSTGSQRPHNSSVFASSGQFFQ